MARPQYPSDEARRKTRPHVRVHLTVATHRKTAAAWANPEMRGILVELWRFAREAHAYRTDGVVVLSRSACASLAGRALHAHNTRAIRALCASVGYAMSETDAGVEITIRNFAKKQGLDSADDGAPTRTPPPSEKRQDKTRREEESDRPAPAGAVVSDPPQPEVERPPRKPDPPAPAGWSLAAAEILRESVTRRWPKTPVPESLVAWARELEKIRGEPDDVASLVAWYAHPDRDRMAYLPECRAGKSFREKYDRVLAARQRAQEPPRAPPTPSRRPSVPTDYWKQRMAGEGST